MRAKTPQEIWEAALGELQVQVSKPNYRTWFGKTIGLSYDDNQFVVGVPNTFVAEYLEKNQHSLIKKALIGLTSPAVQIVFQVNGKPHSQQETRDVAQSINIAKPTYSTKLNPEYVFDSFIEGSSNRLARAAAQAGSDLSAHEVGEAFIEHQEETLRVLPPTREMLGPGPHHAVGADHLGAIALRAHHDGRRPVREKARAREVPP